MRLILFRIAVVAAITLIVWVVAGSRVSQMIDRFGTIAYGTLPLGHYELSEHQFIIGSRRWILGANTAISNDERGRMTLSSDGRTFAFGAVYAGRAASPDSYFRFDPDPGDTISFVQRRSALPWPTPLRFNIMGARGSTWDRHSYRELTWTKASGATITMVWPDMQSFFEGTGWTDGNLEIAPDVAISAVPAERKVISYLAEMKSWQRDDYRLEHLAPSGDGTYRIVAAIQLHDAHAASPGASRSVLLRVDARTNAVIGEIGPQ